MRCTAKFYSGPNSGESDRHHLAVLLISYNDDRLHLNCLDLFVYDQLLDVEVSLRPPRGPPCVDHGALWRLY